jgi:peptide/nickel transport system ATP-binding protein
MAVILVTHDLGVIAGRTERVAVMYGGQIIEQASTAEVFAGPRHPYTEALFDALPEMASPAMASGNRGLYSIPGRPPDLMTRPPGCSFAPRCRHARGWCASHEPALDGDHPGHTYACFFPVGVSGGAGPAGAVRAAGDVGRPVSAWATGVARQAGSSPAPPGAPDAAAEPLLRVSGLVKDYPVTGGVLGRRSGAVSAVAGVSFEVQAGQTFGLVGESGSGKTSIARLLVGLERPDAGAIVFGGADLAAMSARQMRQSRSGIQLMFQDSFASLDPRMRVRSILSEPLAIQKTVRRRGHRRQVLRILDEVGLPAEAASRYAREFSGGQRQRLALARALILRPALIVADEPVSALDVSVQAQILNLMRKLQRQYGLSYLFISHDLSVIRYMADTIGVMYFGKLVETGPTEEVCAAPAHPYTAGLIAAVPAVASPPATSQHVKSPPVAGTAVAGTAVAGTAVAGTAVAGTAVVGTAQPGGSAGTVAWSNGTAGLQALVLAPTQPPSGCRFRTRCAFAQEICAEQEPLLRPHIVPGQLVACHFPLRPGAADRAAGQEMPSIA